MRRKWIYILLILPLIACLHSRYKPPAEIKAALEAAVKDQLHSHELFQFIGVMDKAPVDDILHLRHADIYKDNIELLLNGSGDQRILAYDLVARLKDTSYYTLLLNRLKNPQGSSNTLGALEVAVMKAYPDSTDLVFDFLVKREIDEGVSYGISSS